MGGQVQERESEMMAVMQQHLQEQQELQKYHEQNKLMLEIMKKLCDKFMYESYITLF